MINSKNIKKLVLKNETFDTLNRIDSSEVSNASVEIMLERFFNGKEIDFPFSQ